MKKLMVKALAVLAFVITTAVSALGQNGFAYQAVIRNANGELVANKGIVAKFTLLNEGKSYYSETQEVSTNQYGNIQVVVGNGEKVNGAFDSVPWNTLNIDMKVEVAIDGNNFIEVGTTKIQTAPYAMHAKNAGGYAANNSASKDGDALFSVNDANGNPVFAVFNEGIVVYVDDADKAAKRSGFVVTGRSATKGEAAAEYFTVTTEGTHIYVDDADSKAAKRSGFVVTGRSATKDGELSNYLTVGGEGTTVYVDDADDKAAKRSGFVVTGRSATKDGAEPQYFSATADGTTVYVDDSNDKAAKRSGFVVTGRSATKDGDLADYLAVGGEGTHVFIDGADDEKAAKRSGFVVTGRSATKDDETLFAIEGGYTRVYVDDDDDKATKRSGFVVTGRSATKGGKVLNFIDINPDSTNLLTKTLNVSNHTAIASDTMIARPQSLFTISNGNLHVDGDMSLLGDVTKKVDADTIPTDSIGLELPKLAKIIDRADTVECSIYKPFIYGDESDDEGYALLGIYSKGSYAVVDKTDDSGNKVLLIDEYGFVTKKQKSATVAVLMPKGENLIYIRPLKATNQTVNFGLMKSNSVEPYQYIKVDVEVEAKEGIAYNVVVESSDGGHVDMKGSAVYGEKLTFEAVPDDDNHVFAGWSDNNLRAKRTITVTDDMELFAQFDLRSYEVTAKSNNDDFGSVTGSDRYEYGTTATLVATPTEGYHLAGWDGIELDEELATSETITFEVYKRLNITAKFEVNMRKLTYQIEGEEEPLWSGDVAFSQQFPAVEVENRRGYEFSGWQNKLESMPNCDYTITGSFTAIPYNIDYVLDGGTMPDEYFTSYTVEDNVPLPEPTKDYYDFTGWINTLGDTVQNFAVGTIGDTSLTASWKPTEYKITYDEDGWTVPADAKNSYNVETPDIILFQPEKECLDFTGWSTNDLSKPTMDYTIVSGSHGDIHFTANWEAKKHTVTFVPGGEREDITLSVNCGNTVEQLTIDSLGHKFLGWYNGENKFDFENTPVTDDITLTARWSVITELYVATLENATGNETGYTLNDALPSITDAALQIYSMNAIAADSAWTIYVDGTISGEQYIGDVYTAILDDHAGSHGNAPEKWAASIRIVGQNNATLTNAQGDGTQNTEDNALLSVCTNIPVTIENLTITCDKRNSEYNGSGLIVGDSDGLAKASVTIGKDVVISNFATENMGGGVYIGKNSTVTMTDGSIEDNTSSCGGGVYISEDAQFVMNGGTIQRNSIKSGIVWYNCLGGAIYNGGTFKIGGSAYIPSTETYYPGKNDVYLASTDDNAINKIIIDNAITSAEQTIMAITPARYGQNMVVLDEADSKENHYIKDNHSKFAVRHTLDEDERPTASWAVDENGNMIQMVTLHFQNAVGEEYIATMTVPAGSKLEAKDIPSATYSEPTYDAQFDYQWCYDTWPDGLVPFNFESIPTGNSYTLLPKWSATLVVKEDGMSMSGAIDLITLLNATIDYTIMVDGKLEGSQTIVGIISERESGDPEEHIYDTTPIPARSITLCGKNGNGTDIIDAGWKLEEATVEDGDETFIEEYWSNEYNEELDGRWDKSRPLTICTTVPVTIKDLTITRGLAINGGGLYIAEHATVTIADNTLITGNVADAALSCGGGVYMAENSTLYMTGGLITENQAYGGGGVFVSPNETINGIPAVFYMSGGQITDNQAEYCGGGVAVGGKLYMFGSAVIGNANATESATASSHSNQATYSGGGIYSYAASGYDRGVYIGYTNDLTPDPNFTGGVFHNYASGYYDESEEWTYDGEGGGIYSDNSGYVYLNGKVNYNGANSNGGGIYITGDWGTLVMDSGEINHNTSGADGGGVYLSGCYAKIDNLASLPEIIGGTISYNQSNQGAGIYLDSYGKITMTGGEISGNTLNGADEYSYGSGIYVDGDFTMSGSAKVTEGNDIYLPDGKDITVGNLDEGEDIVATITPESYRNYYPILIEIDTSKHYIANHYDRFAVTPQHDSISGKDIEWLLNEYGTITRRVTVTYYINNQEHTVVLEGDAPFESKVADPSENDIPEDCEFAQWNAIDNGEYVPVKDIYCDTTLYAVWQRVFMVTTLDEWNAACDSLTEPMCRYTIKVDGTVEGQFVIPATAKSLQVIITGNGEDDELKANTQGSVLTVNSTEAPIFINNLIIVGGKSANGGGIYINNDATVALGNRVYVRGNTAIYDDEDDNTGRGGGVYNAGTLFMYGSARIGSDSSWVASNDYKSNLAERGGGLYNAATGIVYLGFSSETQTTNLDGGICCNYANSNGGGVFNDGIIRMNSGYIANNGTNGSGGGVYNAGTMYMWGDAVIGDQYTQEPAGSSSYSHSNYAQSGGGGICNKGRLYLGYSNADTEAELYGGVYYNYSDDTNGGSGGGGIYNFLSSGSDFAMASGNIAYNTAHDSHSGGGISFGGMDDISVNITGGTITWNTAGNGGGIDCGSHISLYVSDAEISYNSANYKSSGTNASSGGGGINVNYGSLTLDDSTKIIGNVSANHGGGINVWGTNSVIIKGNTIISGNTVSTTTADKYCGGAIYTANTTLTFEGNAYVPYGGGKRQNDIVIDGGWNTHSLVAGDLSDNTHSEIATITLSDSEYENGAQVLQFPEGMETNDAAMRFNVPDSDWGILSDGTLCEKTDIAYSNDLYNVVRQMIANGVKYIRLAGTATDSVKIDRNNGSHLIFDTKDLEISVKPTIMPRIEFEYINFKNATSLYSENHSGGMIYADGFASLEFHHCTFVDNHIEGEAQSEYNIATDDSYSGAAIFATNVPLITIDSCTFRNTTCPNIDAFKGGFINFYSGCKYASIDSVTFTNGRARHGGAICINSDDNMVTSISNSVFMGNTTDYNGIIDYSKGKVLDITNTTFTDNNSTDSFYIIFNGPMDSGKDGKLIINGEIIEEHLYN